MSASGAGSVSPLLIVAIVPVGAGLGLAIPALIHLVLRAVPPTDAGTASGMLTTSQQIGNALGVAILGTTFFQVLGGRSGAAPYGHAFTVTIGVQLVLALTAAVLVSRARARRSHAATPSPEAA